MKDILKAIKKKPVLCAFIQGAGLKQKYLGLQTQAVLTVQC